MAIFRFFLFLKRDIFLLYSLLLFSFTVSFLKSDPKTEKSITTIKNDFFISIQQSKNPIKLNVNLLNICYLTSITSLIMGMPKLLEAIKTTNNDISNLLKEIIEITQQKAKNPYYQLTSLANKYELLKNNIWKTKIKSENSKNPYDMFYTLLKIIKQIKSLKDLFSFHQKNSILCQNCNYTFPSKNTKCYYLDLNLNLTLATHNSIKDNTSSFPLLHKKLEVKCPQCKLKTLNEKIEIINPPPFLLLKIPNNLTTQTDIFNSLLQFYELSAVIIFARNEQNGHFITTTQNENSSFLEYHYLADQEIMANVKGINLNTMQPISDDKKIYSTTYFLISGLKNE